MSGGTGRITEEISPLARGILFASIGAAELREELPTIAEIDRAHLVMLARTGILPLAVVRRTLAAIEDLRRSEFHELAGQCAPRGVFLLYESHLRQTCGDDAGGVLQTARSRNDLNATRFRLALRRPFLSLLNAVGRLQAVLLGRARRFRNDAMPLYTHHQPAVEITYGHYLAGLATAMGRDLSGLLANTTDLQTSPLGACAGGGTSLPIDTALTADLLGFDTVASHSIDAVASRDLELRILGAMIPLGITLSRAATDLLLWSTGEFGFLELPDRLVGSSSAMPQKRNPFLLEHVQARVSSALGAFVAATTAMHAVPFTNSIAVGTEAVSHLWRPLRELKEAALLLGMVVRGARWNRHRARERVRTGFTGAIEFANQLVTAGGMDFRSAHHLVGRAARSAFERGETVLDAAMARELELAGLPLELHRNGAGPSCAAGGGPAPETLSRTLDRLRTDLRGNYYRIAALRLRWLEAGRRLDSAVNGLLAECFAETLLH